MRPKPLPIALLVLCLLAPACASGSPSFSGRIYAEWYSARPRLAPDTALDFKNAYLGTQLNGASLLGHREMSVDGFVSLRALQTFRTDVPFDPSWFVYQGYLQFRSRKAGWLKVGRVFQRGGVGARTADGASLLLQPNRNWAIRAFLGGAVDPLEPAAVGSVKNNLWSGGQITYRLSRARFSVVTQLEKLRGLWIRRLIGGDLWATQGRHQLEGRYYYNSETRRTDELKAAYTLRLATSWRIAARYQYRDPRVTFWSVNPGLVDFDVTARQTAGMYVTVDLGSSSTLTGEVAAVRAAGLHAVRYGARIHISGFAAAYHRREGHGPVHDQIHIRGRRGFGRAFQAALAVGFSQFNLAPDGGGADQSASFATADLVWSPSGAWAFTAEGQALENPRSSYDLRLFVRAERRIGGAAW
jgi:hypothetical protein